MSRGTVCFEFEYIYIYSAWVLAGKIDHKLRVSCSMQNLHALSTSIFILGRLKVLDWASPNKQLNLSGLDKSETGLGKGEVALMFTRHMGQSGLLPWGVNEKNYYIYMYNRETMFCIILL